jgi:hypothetical protein
MVALFKLRIRQYNAKKARTTLKKRYQLPCYRITMIPLSRQKRNYPLAPRGTRMTSDKSVLHLLDDDISQVKL